MTAPRYVGSVRIPTKATLRRYGMTEDDWRALLESQGGACGVCGKVPASSTLHIDHAHARGWAKLAPERRKAFVRGLACWMCNSVWLRRGATPERLRAAADYLERYLTASAQIPNVNSAQKTQKARSQNGISCRG